MRIWKARDLTGANGSPSPSGAPGEIVELRPEGAVVITGDGAVLVETVQIEGEPPRAASEALRGASRLGG